MRPSAFNDQPTAPQRRLHEVVWTSEEVLRLRERFGTPVGLPLAGVQLVKANLSLMELHGADLNRANLQRANLGQANLAGAQFIEADLRSVQAERSNLRLAVLLRAIMYRVNFGQVDL